MIEQTYGTKPRIQVFDALMYVDVGLDVFTRYDKGVRPNAILGRRDQEDITMPRSCRWGVLALFVILLLAGISCWLWR